MGFLQSLLDSSTIPLVTAFLLGLLTAISPCPLATNITAIGYIGRECGSARAIFRRGLLYTLGRVITYTALGVIVIPILREGASMYAIQRAISRYGEMIISPALIIIGLMMLFGNRLNLPKFGYSPQGVKRSGGWGALLLGVLFSLAFCPTSGVLYFGVLMPLSAASTGGYLLPVVFALATALPVIIVSWILAYSISELGKFYNRMQTFQKYMNTIIALLFITVGIYYAIILYL